MASQQYDRCPERRSPLSGLQCQVYLPVSKIRLRPTRRCRMAVADIAIDSEMQFFQSFRACHPSTAIFNLHPWI
jgi:hypothetical protein